MNAVVAVPDDVSQRGGGLGCALFLRRNPKSCTARRCSSNCGATIRGGQLRAVGRVNSVSSVGEFRVFNSLELRQRELKAAIGDKRWCFGADENDPGLRKCRRSGLLQNPVATGVAPPFVYSRRADVADWLGCSRCTDHEPRRVQGQTTPR